MDQKKKEKKYQRLESNPTTDVLSQRIAPRRLILKTYLIKHVFAYEILPVNAVWSR